MFQSKNHLLALLFLLSLAGILVLLYATHLGIGVSPDSTVYIGAARSLLDGHGLRALSGSSPEPVPMTHYPPLYPLLLALAGASSRSDPLSAARWLNAFIFGANILLAGLSLSVYTRWSWRVAALGSTLVLAAPDILEIHSMAWTEPLFILLCLVGLFLLAAYFEGQRRALLMASAAVVALAFTTRYVGIVAVAAGVVGLLLVGARSYSRRIADAALYAFIACLPMALWMMRNRRVAGGATDRKLVFHPVGFQQLSAGLSTISTWLLLGRASTGVRASVFFLELACLIALGVLFRRGKPVLSAGETGTPQFLARLPSLLSIFIILYLGFFIFTASFVDYDTVFDDRALAPVHLPGLVLLLCLAHKLLERPSKAGHLLQLAAIVLGFAFAGSYLARGVSWTRQKSADGQGYASRAWQESATIARVKSLAAETPIFTNGYDAVYFLTGRPAFYLPEKIIHGTGQANALYSTELAHIREQMVERDGVLVYFAGFPERVYLPTESELKEQLHLRLVSRETDGAVYRAEP